MIHEPYWPTFPVAYCTSTGHPPYQAGQECPECRRLREMVKPAAAIDPDGCEHGTPWHEWCQRCAPSAQ